MLSIWSESPYCKRTAVSRSHKQLTMPWCSFWMDSTIQPLATFENFRTNFHSDCGTVANQRCQKQDRRTNLCPIGNRLLRNLRLLELCPIQSNEMFVSKVSQLHSEVLFFIPPISGNTPCTKRLVVAFVASKFHCATQSAHSKQASPALSYKPYISCSQHTADQNAACSQAVFRHQDHVLGRSMAPDNALSEFSWQNLPPPILVEEPFDACKRMPRTATYLGQNWLKDVMGSYFCTNLKMLTWLCKWFKLERGVKERCSSMAFFFWRIIEANLKPYHELKRYSSWSWQFLLPICVVAVVARGAGWWEEDEEDEENKGRKWGGTLWWISWRRQWWWHLLWGGWGGPTHDWPRPKWKVLKLPLHSFRDKWYN